MIVLTNSLIHQEGEFENPDKITKKLKCRLERFLCMKFFVFNEISLVKTPNKPDFSANLNLS